jgi:cytochrome c oxidase accessory protein FixG
MQAGSRKPNEIQAPVFASQPDGHSQIIAHEDLVLPTLWGDGSRKWLNPKLATGKWWNRRRWLAYALIAFFVTLPHLRWNGRPLVLLDIVRREFTILGHTFYPTDTPLVAILMLLAFTGIMLVTAVGGRVWCGWGCPQTVYLEFLFRPIDRVFKKLIDKQPLIGKPLRLLTYLVCSLFLAHTFLSYFVGTDRLAQWMQLWPWEHPTAFLVMGGATAALLFDFLFFREQFCMIACPYGRFQSVMLDRQSLIVTYDIKRGEPREKGKRRAEAKVGDCVDCGRCTAVCPTGIDIRNGLQMECIHCAQCIDACDSVMEQVGFAPGLIRYSSTNAMEGQPVHWLRPRTIIYPVLIGILGTLFVYVLSTKFALDARIMRSPGAPFTLTDPRTAQNNFKVRLVNRSQVDQTYSIELTQPSGGTADWSSSKELRLKPGESTLAPIAVHFPIQQTARTGVTPATVRVKDESGNEREVTFQLLGPR